MNPVKGVLTINPGNITIDQLELYSPIGILVKSVKNSNSINMHYLSSGMYFVKIYSDKGNATIKIIKE
ncbi:T9SS type A sorting domain-containing protein [Flavobacterium sp.]|uniref:T9SS type A sorting domain-containing protein n=1 Tax=Flavobacterium sp. TaxID=239 RepID=UPI0039C8BDD3